MTDCTDCTYSSCTAGCRAARDDADRQFKLRVAAEMRTALAEALGVIEEYALYEGWFCSHCNVWTAPELVTDDEEHALCGNLAEWRRQYAIPVATQHLGEGNP